MSTQPIYCALLVLAIKTLGATEPFEEKAIVANNEKQRIDQEIEKHKILHYVHQLMHDRKISYSKCKVCKVALPTSSYLARQK